VPGIDAIFVGPNDLAASMRSPDGKPPSAGQTAEVMKEILAACRRNKVAAGVHSFSAEEVVKRIEEGWQFLAINSELKMMVDEASSVLKAIGVRQKADMAKY
jgi:4-hydroxy-2-oxoheptanedioate aldolase